MDPEKQLLHYDLEDSADEDEEVPLIYDSTKDLNLKSYERWHRESPINISIFQDFALSLLPSFVVSWWKPSSEPPRHKSTIASLDGLRGLACVIVFNDHFVRLFIPRSGLPKLFTGSPLSFIFQGRGAVSVFFVISGYVLSHKPLRLIRSQEYPDFQKSITSSVFRRVIRLCLPPLIAACLLCLVAVAGGFDEAEKAYYAKRTLVSNIPKQFN